MNRRYFLPLLPAALTPHPRLRAAAGRKVVVALFDGFGPEYVEASDMPNLRRMMRGGHFKVGKGVIPSVTNVNNASLITSSFPAGHGITTNFFFDEKTGEAKEMESGEYLLRPTLLEKAKARGWKTALATTKDKVRTLCSRGADVAVSAEKPAADWMRRIGPKENMYSAPVNYWTMRAARALLRDGVDLLYLSTTDYMMHTYGPKEAPSLEHLHTMDKLVADLADDHPKLELYLTADHGMNAKREAIDPARALAGKGIAAEAVPIIRDKHKVHHGNLGGACYVYLKNKADGTKAADLLRAVVGIEEVYDNRTAARQFHLHPERIGDLFLLAAKDVAFGELNSVREPAKVRTHGSRYEARVPLLIHGRKVQFGKYEYNLDLTRYLDLERG